MHIRPAALVGHPDGHMMQPDLLPAVKRRAARPGLPQREKSPSGGNKSGRIGRHFTQTDQPALDEKIGSRLASGYR
jgi:hypothetical protein